MTDLAELDKLYKATFLKWETSGRICACGRPITFEELFTLGECCACLDEIQNELEPEYYIDGEHDDHYSERGPFVVIFSHAIDGNIADVYGETLAEARAMAELIVNLLNRGVLPQEF